MPLMREAHGQSSLDEYQIQYKCIDIVICLISGGKSKCAVINLIHIRQKN